MCYRFCVTLRVALIGVMLTGLVCLSGCKESDKETGSNPANLNPSDDVNGPDANGGGSLSSGTGYKEPRDVKPVMPEVMLPDVFAKKCLVKVNDTMPDVVLNSLENQPVSLNKLMGDKKLTVVCFWKINPPRAPGEPSYANDELRNLQTFIAEPYASEGVQVVAINEADPADEAAKEFYKEKKTYPCLLDPRGEYFAKVATEGVPRVYLLDSTGKILWFDVEFSTKLTSTRRDLEQAIRFKLEEEKDKKPEVKSE